jgi:hypothetical protein
LWIWQEREFLLGPGDEQHQSAVSVTPYDKNKKPNLLSIGLVVKEPLVSSRQMYCQRIGNDEDTPTSFL